MGPEASGMEAVSWVNRGDGLETPGRRMGSDREAWRA